MLRGSLNNKMLLMKLEKMIMRMPTLTVDLRRKIISQLEINMEEAAKRILQDNMKNLKKCSALYNMVQPLRRTRETLEFQQTAMMSLLLLQFSIPWKCFRNLNSPQGFLSTRMRDKVSSTKVTFTTSVKMKRRQ